MNRRTPSPTSSSSQTPSWPSANGAGYGATPLTIASSRSHVATHKGRTSAPSSLPSSGTGSSRHSSSSAPKNVKAGKTGSLQLSIPGRADSARPARRRHAHCRDATPNRGVEARSRSCPDQRAACPGLPAGRPRGIQRQRPPATLSSDPAASGSWPRPADTTSRLHRSERGPAAAAEPETPARTRPVQHNERDPVVHTRSATPSTSTAAAAAAAPIEVRAPTDGRLLGTVPHLDAGDVALAAARARIAQPGWEALGFDGRARVLRRGCKWVLEHRREIVETISAEN